MPERKVYRFRIDPTAKQEAALARYAGARRFVFNWALQRRKETYQQTGKSIPWSELSVELTALKSKPGFEWLKEIDSQLLQQAIADCKKAFDNFFQKRARFPKFKKKHGAQQSFRIPQRVKLENGRVYIPKIGWVKLRQSQALDLPLKSARFRREATGKWYVSLVAEFDLPDLPKPSIETETAIGIDVGLIASLPTPMEAWSKTRDSSEKPNAGSSAPSGNFPASGRVARIGPKRVARWLVNARRSPTAALTSLISFPLRSSKRTARLRAKR